MENLIIYDTEIYKTVNSIVKENRMHKERFNALEAIGLNKIEYFACGTGGVNRIRVRRKGHVYVQVTCGLSKYNYAYCVFIGKLNDNKEFEPIEL